ncbi:hypothetical protein P2H44_00210 [Albimonas sp. CAU 1670]|uniref:hypothetical protein n=1 Tax=Albimonas sp. CAU 1670 TaxID=3032599 RepID=UPI0023DBC269|nr:hypothetical protein [Albimonas sp. CAU 1670]MDF2230965.1 hypothetical protein [Albimonas sp. CAU 1670]
MKLSATKLYVESYVKCRCCGILIYDAGRADAVERDGELFCSSWCVDWHDARSSAPPAGGAEPAPAG